MKHVFHRAGLLGLVLAVLSLSAFAQEPAVETASDEAAAPAQSQPEAAAAEAPETTADAPDAAATGRIIFFRPKKFAGSAMVFKVREGEEVIGMLKSGTYFTVDVAPGTHVYAMRSEAKDELTIEVEAGETYYVAASVQMGVLAGRPNLSPSDQAAFEEADKKGLKDTTGDKGRSGR